MAEYDTWLRQEREYKNIIDQLKVSFVQAVVSRLEAAHSTIIPEWEQCVISLTKEYEISKENSQHLSLIMEYLKVLPVFLCKNLTFKMYNSSLYPT